MAATGDSNNALVELTNIESVIADKLTSATSTKSEGSLEDEKKKDSRTLTLQPRIKNLPPHYSFIEALDEPGHVFLPLTDLILMFGSPIEFDKDNNKASGYFILPGNTFSLDVAKREFRVGDKRWEMTRNTMRRRDGELYISSDSFAEWFGVKSEIDRTKAVVYFTPAMILPQDEKEERQKKWRSIDQADSSDKNPSPVLQKPYQGTGYILLNNNPATLKSAEATLSEDKKPRSGLTDFRSFRGDATPESDVELYRDDDLVAAQTVGKTGHYEFTNTPVYAGKNVFRIKLYGPHGEYEERVEALTSSGPAFLAAPIQLALSNGKSPENNESIGQPNPNNLNALPASQTVEEIHKNVPADNGMNSAKMYAPLNQFSNATANNWIKLTAVRDNRTLGSIDAYVDIQGTFLRINSVIELLGLSYNRQETPDTAAIVLKDGSTILLDFHLREFIENKNHHSFYHYDIYKKEDEYYANTDLLNRILPQVGFVVDLASLKVDLSTVSGGLAGLWGGNAPVIPSDLAPTPQAAPVQPVIIDDMTGRQRISGSSSAPPDSSAPARDVLQIIQNDKVPEKKVEPSRAPTEIPVTIGEPSPQEAVPSSKPEEGPTKSEQKPSTATEENKDEGKKEGGETLILLPRIKNLPPNNEFIEALDWSGQIFLPLNDLIQMFGFPIKFDKDHNKANGFFFSPENTFSLDVEKHEVRVGDKSWEVTQNNMRLREGQIYVSSESFSEWFGIQSEIDRTKAIIHFTTDKLLPQEEQEERQKRWRTLLGAVESNDKDYPVLQNPYQAFGYPVVDVNIGTLYTHSPSSSSSSSGGAGPFAANYNIQGSADLAYLTSQFFAQGSLDGGNLNVLRFQAGRKDPNADLLGALHATEFAFGDVTSPSLSLVTNNSLGRGVTLTNRDINASENFDTRNFTGDSVPGFEVELYRNNVLISFQTVDASGRYNFVNIPILFGENIFRIVFYGQQGQREERVETVSASSSLLKENQFVYTFGADQRGESLIPINQNNSSNINTPPGLQAVGGFRYGITQDITVGAALAETNLIDGEHQYVNASTGANIAGVLTETNLAQDITNNGWAASAAALGGFEGVSLRARYRKFENFLSEAVNSLDVPLTSDQSLDANTQLYLPVLGDYSVGLSALRETFVDQTRVPRYTYSWRSSKSLWGLSFTDSIDYVIDEEKRFQDTFGVQTRIWDINFRAVGITDMKPVQQFRYASLMADYHLMDRLSAQTQIDKDMTNDQTSLGQNFSWDFDDFRLSFTSQMANTGTYTAGLNLIFSINHDAATNRWRTQPQQTSDGGSIGGRAYIDENSNNKLDEGEKIVPDAKIKVNNMSVKLGPDGYFVSPVTTYQVNRLEMDSGSISDPLLTPVTKGYRVLTRPGDNVVADFPLVRTTIIDGSVVFLDDKGSKRELGDIVVELEDRDGKPLRRVISEIDGYFSFDKIQAGEYWLSVPDEALTAYNAAVDQKVHIKIEEISEFFTGNEIKLHQKEKLDVPPPMTPPLAPTAPNVAAPPVPEATTLPSAPAVPEVAAPPVSEQEIKETPEPETKPFIRPESVNLLLNAQEKGELTANRTTDNCEARNAYSQARIFYQQENNLPGEANVLRGLGDLERTMGNNPEARDAYGQARRLYQQENNRLAEAGVLCGLGDLERTLGNNSEAREAYSQARALYQQANDSLGEANVLCGLGDLERALGNTREARDVYSQARRLYDG